MVSYDEQRKRNEENDVSQNRHDFGWEEEQCPLLHSGFLQPCTGDDSKSVLFLSIWCTSGSYKCKLLDRQRDEKCFISVGTLGQAFTKLEAALRDDTLDWTPERRSRERN